MTTKKKAPPKVEKTTIQITVKGRTLPFVAVDDLTIRDQLDILASTGNAHTAFWTGRASITPAAVAVWWWMALRHAGDIRSFDAVAFDLEHIDLLKDFRFDSDEVEITLTEADDDPQS